MYAGSSYTTAATPSQYNSAAIAAAAAGAVTTTTTTYPAGQYPGGVGGVTGGVTGGTTYTSYQVTPAASSLSGAYSSSIVGPSSSYAGTGGGYLPGAAGFGTSNVTPGQGPFVFGKYGPPIESEKVVDRNYSVGEMVDVFSKSENTWVVAKVIAVSPEGTVTVKYGSNQKDIQREFYAEYLRPAAKNIESPHRGAPPSSPMHQPPMTMASAPPPMPGGPGGFSIGQAVECYSKSENTWVPAKVTDVDPNGAVTVKYGQFQKTIYPRDFREYLRPAAAGLRTEEYPSPVTAFAPGLGLGPGPAPGPPRAAFDVPPTAFPGMDPRGGMQAPPTAFPGGAAGSVLPTIPGGYTG